MVFTVLTFQHPFKENSHFQVRGMFVKPVFVSFKQNKSTCKNKQQQNCKEADIPEVDKNGFKKGLRNSCKKSFSSLI